MAFTVPSVQHLAETIPLVNIDNKFINKSLICWAYFCDLKDKAYHKGISSLLYLLSYIKMSFILRETVFFICAETTFARKIT